MSVYQLRVLVVALFITNTCIVGGLWLYYMRVLCAGWQKRKDDERFWPVPVTVALLTMVLGSHLYGYYSLKAGSTYDPFILCLYLAFIILFFLFLSFLIGGGEIWLIGLLGNITAFELALLLVSALLHSKISNIGPSMVTLC